MSIWGLAYIFNKGLTTSIESALQKSGSKIEYITFGTLTSAGFKKHEDLIRSKIIQANLNSPNGQIYSLGIRTISHFPFPTVSFSFDLKGPFVFILATALFALTAAQKRTQRLPGFTFLFPLLCVVGIWALFKKASYSLHSTPASMTDFKPPKEVIDFITTEAISNEELQKVRLFHVGPYVSDIVDILNCMLGSNKCVRGEIPHPAEARSLNHDEKKKWLREVAAFFSISSHELEECWDGNAEKEVNQTFQTYFGGLKNQTHRGEAETFTTLISKIEEKLTLAYLPILRKKKFLELMPTDIRNILNLGKSSLSDEEVIKIFSEACDDVQLPDNMRQRFR